MCSQHCGYWCPGAEALSHQYPQRWLSINFIRSEFWLWGGSNVKNQIISCHIVLLVDKIFTVDYFWVNLGNKVSRICLWWLLPGTSLAIGSPVLPCLMVADGESWLWWLAKLGGPPDNRSQQHGEKQWQGSVDIEITIKSLMQEALNPKT